MTKLGTQINKDGLNPVGMFLEVLHPILNVPTKAEIIGIWDNKGLVLAFPCGHVAHLTEKEVIDLVGKLPTTLDEEN